jgi:diguanylate cyclase (GGDEF)-like protein
MTADVPTLLLMIIVTSLVTSGALLVLNGNQRNDGLQYWAGGLLLSALAHTLLLLYGRIPNLLTVVLGNVLLSSALASFWLAVRRFHDLALHWARTLALLAAIALLMWLFQHQFASRVVVSGFTLSLQAALVLWVLRQRSLGAEQQRSRGALLMVDIDHFKRVNDHYGHLAGDHVLRHIVGVLRQRLRASDVLGRYGGEEFMVLLPSTDLHGAAQLAEQLRQAVQAAPCEWQGQRIPFTVSIGVAASADTPADPSRTSEALLQAADQALYRAKDDGRNRVALA